MRVILFILLAFIATTATAQHRCSYYTISGEKVDGYIDLKLSDDYIHFKSTPKGHNTKISINDMKSIITYDDDNVIDDSLVVLTEKGDESKKYFATLIVTGNGTSFYYKYKYRAGNSGYNYSYSPNTVSIAQGNQSSASPNVTWTGNVTRSGYTRIPMYSDNGTTYEVTKSNFVAILGKAFADDTDLASQINSGDLKFKYVDDIFNIYKDYQDSKKIKK